MSPDAGGMSDRACKALADVVVKFVRSQLGLNPGEVFVHPHGGSATVTLKNVLSNSERNAAKERRTADLIARTLTEAFRSVSSILVAQCSSSVGVTAESVTFLLDPQSNCASIILTMKT